VYAQFTEVEFGPGRHDAATQMLNEVLIPRIKEAPGFVRGTWFADDGSGRGVIIFQTEGQARQGMEALASIPMEGVTVIHSGVYQVDAEA
jgi:hypothetical protein